MVTCDRYLFNYVFKCPQVLYRVLGVSRMRLIKRTRQLGVFCVSSSIFVGGAFFVLSFGLGTTGCKRNFQSIDSTSAVIRIGEVETMTGPEAGIGIAIHQGIDLAIRQINLKGGIRGRLLELMTVDDQGKAEEAATAASKLINQSHVIALLGASASSRSIAMAAIAQNHRIPMITPTSTHPKVTELGNSIFRVCFIDSFQGQVMANFALNQLKIKKIAILRDMKSDYSVGLSDFFISTLKKRDGEIVIEQNYSSGDIDFKSQLTAIRSRSPEAIFIPGYYTDVALIARQARDLGITVPLLGGDGWSSPKLLEIGGTAIENAYYSSHYSTDDQSPQVQDFVLQFKTYFGAVPNDLSALGYDSVQVLGDAIRHDPTEKLTELRVALTQTKNFLGVTGKISMDARRNAAKSAVILKVEGGKFRYYSTVAPE